MTLYYDRFGTPMYMQDEDLSDNEAGGDIYDEDSDDIPEDGVEEAIEEDSEEDGEGVEDDAV